MYSLKASCTDLFNDDYILSELQFREVVRKAPGTYGDKLSHLSSRQQLKGQFSPSYIFLYYFLTQTSLWDKAVPKLILRQTHLNLWRSTNSEQAMFGLNMPHAFTKCPPTLMAAFLSSQYIFSQAHSKPIVGDYQLKITL